MKWLYMERQTCKQIFLFQILAETRHEKRVYRNDQIRKQRKTQRTRIITMRISNIPQIKEKRHSIWSIFLTFYHVDIVFCVGARTQQTKTTGKYYKQGYPMTESVCYDLCNWLFNLTLCIPSKSIIKLFRKVKD